MTTEVGQPHPVADEKPSSVERIIGVFMSPATTFESIARRPDFAVPLIIFIVVSLLSGALIARKTDFTAIAHEAMSANPDLQKQVSAERLDRMEKMQAGMMRGFSYAAPLLSVILLLIYAGVMLIACRMFAGDLDFRQAFSVTIYGWFPRLVQSILAAVVILSKKSISIVDLQNPLRANLAFLFDPKKNPVGFALGARFDLFVIWSIVLLIFGFAAAARFSKARAAAIVIAVWVLATLLTLIGPAFQAMRMHS